MFQLFRKYQYTLVFLTTIFVTASYIFFGTYSTLAGGQERKDLVLGKKIDGSSLMLSEVQDLSRFISTDREDMMNPKGAYPNFCNNGVIRYDFIQSGFSHLIAKEYFESFKNDFVSRLDRAKRFRPYAHPETELLSAKNIWDRFFPDLFSEIEGLKGKETVDFKVFESFEKLYAYQSRLKPETLRQILLQQHRQLPSIQPDQKLAHLDLALFGFHSASDWFGKNFIDCLSQFILNVSAIAEEKGYRASIEEAKGDLIRQFDESMEKLNSVGIKPEITFYSHLQMLGFSERRAYEIWQKVLVFRKYMQDIGESAFLDTLSYKDLQRFDDRAKHVQLYRFPIQIGNQKDFDAYQFYVNQAFVLGKDDLPERALSVEEVEAKCPQLVEKRIIADVKEVSLKQVCLQIPVKKLWKWQTDQKNWKKIQKQFKLQKVKAEEAFAYLQSLSPQERGQINSWARKMMVRENPHLIDEALSKATSRENTYILSADEELLTRSKNIYRSIDSVKDEKKRILLFAEAKEKIFKLMKEKSTSFDVVQGPFAKCSKIALSDLQNDPNDSRWLQSGTDPLMDQFKLIKEEKMISNATQEEDWMKNVNIMLSKQFSPIEIAEGGEVKFFYIDEIKDEKTPILEQIVLGKQMLCLDAKIFAAEKILSMVKEKNAIVIPLQKDEE